NLLTKGGGDERDQKDSCWPYNHAAGHGLGTIGCYAVVLFRSPCQGGRPGICRGTGTRQQGAPLLSKPGQGSQSDMVSRPPEGCQRRPHRSTTAESSLFRGRIRRQWCLTGE